MTGWDTGVVSVKYRRRAHTYTQFGPMAVTNPVFQAPPPLLPLKCYWTRADKISRRVICCGLWLWCQGWRPTHLLVAPARLPDARGALKAEAGDIGWFDASARSLDALALVLVIGLVVARELQCSKLQCGELQCGEMQCRALLAGE